MLGRKNFGEMSDFRNYVQSLEMIVWKNVSVDKQKNKNQWFVLENYLWAK